MNKGDLITTIASNTGVSKKTATEMLDVLIESVQNNLARGKDVRVAGLGRFHVNERNPRTGESIKIPAKKVVKFTTYNDLESKVNS